MDIITNNWKLVLKAISELLLIATIFVFVIRPRIESIIHKKMSQYRDDALRYMGEAKRYADEAREDKKEIAQIKETVARDREEITKKAEAINSQLSSTQDRSKTVLHLETDADAKDINVQIRDEYVEPN